MIVCCSGAAAPKAPLCKGLAAVAACGLQMLSAEESCRRSRLRDCCRSIDVLKTFEPTQKTVIICEFADTIFVIQVPAAQSLSQIAPSSQFASSLYTREPGGAPAPVQQYVNQQFTAVTNRAVPNGVTMTDQPSTHWPLAHFRCGLFQNPGFPLLLRQFFRIRGGIMTPGLPGAGG